MGPPNVNSPGYLDPQIRKNNALTRKGRWLTEKSPPLEILGSWDSTRVASLLDHYYFSFQEILLLALNELIMAIRMPILLLILILISYTNDDKYWLC